MKIYHPKHLDKVMHISKSGEVYQLDSLWKMEEIAKKLATKYPVEDVDGVIDQSLFESFHTPEFVKALLTGQDREELIETCGVFWQPWLPLAMFNRAKAMCLAVENLLKGDSLSVSISGGGHHTTPFKAYGFGPINAVGIALYSLKKELGDMKVAVLDLDVHQGNGFSFIEAPNVRLFDIWGMKLNKWEVNKKNKNYLSFKVLNSADWQNRFEHILRNIGIYSPDILVYYSGADVISSDRMGGIKGYTQSMFEKREKRVFEFLSENDIKTLLSIGGGYVNYGSKKVNKEKERLVDLHIYSIQSAINCFN